MSPIKRRPEGHDENNYPSPKRLKLDVLAHLSPTDSLTTQIELPKRLFASEEIPNPKTSTAITDIADCLGITTPNLEFLVAHGVDIQRINRQELLAQATQLGFSETELSALTILPDDHLLAQVSLTAKLAQSGMPSHVLIAGRAKREKGITSQLVNMLKAQCNPQLSSLKGAERWRQVLELPDELFPFSWNATEEESERHIHLICNAISEGMTIADIELVIKHNKLQKTIEYIENPKLLGIPPKALERLSLSALLHEYIINVLIYDMPTDVLQLEKPHIISQQWRSIKLLGISTPLLLNSLKAQKLSLLNDTAKEAHQAGIPRSIFKIVTAVTDLNGLLVLCSQKVKLNYNLISQMCQLTPEIGLRCIIILYNEVSKKLNPTNTPPEMFDQLLLQYHRLCQYGVDVNDIGFIGDVAVDLLQFFEKHCFRKYEQAEINAIVYALRGNQISPESVWLTLEIMAQESWMLNTKKSKDTHKQYCDILAFSSVTEMRNITEKDKASIIALFRAGINATLIRDSIFSALDGSAEVNNLTDCLENLQRIAHRLFEMALSPQEIEREGCLQDLQDCLARHEDAHQYIEKYSQMWNVSGDTWVLKSDPTITTSRLKLEKAIHTAFRIHTSVEVEGTDTVIQVGDSPNDGDKLVLRTRKGKISAIYISAQLLGQGTYGVVHKAVYQNGRLWATKTARPGKVKNIYEEFLTLDAICKDQQSITGLQPYPSALLLAGTPPADLSFFSIVNELFSHNLWEETYGHVERNPQKPIDRMIPDRNVPQIAEEYLSVTTQLAQGLEYLHSKEFAHLDIKPANTGVHKPKRSVFHIDLGSAQSTIATADDKPRFRGHTWWYAQEADVCERERAFKAGNYNRYKFVMEGMDVYAMGMSFYEFLTQSLPFKVLKKATYPIPQNFDFNRQAFEANHVPDSLIDLVADMIELEIEKRPSAAEVVQRLGKISSEIAGKAI